MNHPLTNVFCSLYPVGEDEQSRSGPSGAVDDDDDDDDPENRYGSKRDDLAFVTHPRRGRKATARNPESSKTGDRFALKTRSQSRLTRSCARPAAIKYTF